MPYFSVVGEGSLDLAVGKIILRHCGHEIAYEFDKGGKSKIDQNLGGYANASRQGHWLVLRDLDTDADCAPDLLQEVFPQAREFPSLHLRVPVREIEAWLLGDAASLARFFGVRVARVPAAPESLPDAKAALINLARESRYRNIREAVVPRQGSGRSVGPEYNAVMAEFATQHWALETAAQNCDSLARCVARLTAAR